jgi:hypothetical protein
MENVMPTPEGSKDRSLLHRLFADQGIKSLDDLVARVAEESSRTGLEPTEILQGRPPEAPVARDPAFPKAKATGAYFHRPTELAILLDDERQLKPDGLREFDGTALDFVYDYEGEERGRLRAFTTPHAAAQYMKSVKVRDELSPDLHQAVGLDRTPSFHVGGTQATFFQHINFGGTSLTLALGHAWTDLTQVTLSGWWFWAVSWNNQISSVVSGSGWLTLWDNVYPPTFGLPPGSKLTFAPFMGASSLVPLGWNDRVSAINHHFFAF